MNAIDASNAEIIQGVVVAAITAGTIAIVLWIGKLIGRWFSRSVARSFSEQVVEVMAPDMARLGNRVGQAIDELRISNTAEHQADQKRLSAVEDRLDAVEDRLVQLDGRLPYRPPGTRSRVTDPDQEGEIIP